MAKNTIEHDGIVTQVAETFIIVTIQSQTACAGCHAKGACGMSEMALKSITAEKPNEDVKIGDKVIVSASTQNAMLSVLLAYIVPSTLMVTAGRGYPLASITGSSDMTVPDTELCMFADMKPAA